MPHPKSQPPIEVAEPPGIEIIEVPDPLDIEAAGSPGGSQEDGGFGGAELEESKQEMFRTAHIVDHFAKAPWWEGSTL